MKIRFSLLALFQMLFVFFASAQTRVSPDAPGNEVSKFLSYPVSLNTGVPEISVPLYSIEFGGSQIPITLRYHASGLQVGQKTGLVGAGWSISPDYEITRTMRGRADEYYNVRPDMANYDFSLTQGEPGSIGLPNLFATKAARDIYLAKFIIPDVNAGGTYDNSIYPPNFLPGLIYDSEMDIFRYSLPDRSGRFVFETRSPFKALLLDDDTRKTEIKFDKGARYEDSYFNVKDDKGWSYKLGGENFSQENIVNNRRIKTGWYLQNIHALNGDSINFFYWPNYSNEPTPQKSSYIKEGCKECLPYFTSVYNVNSLDTAQIFQEKEWLPDSVAFPGGSISYSYASGIPSIDSKLQMPISNITIRDLDKNIIRKINFYYTAGTRFTFLDSVSINGGVEKPLVYRFEYNKNNQLGLAYDSLPLDADFWGYYKRKDGASSVKTQISFNDANIDLPIFDPSLPSAPIADMFVPLATISPKMRFNQKIVLYDDGPMYVIKKVIYPTGGYTEYKFDHNFVGQTFKYNPGNDYTLPGPGFRIKEIISNDGITGNTMRKTYTYQDGLEDWNTQTWQPGYGFMLNINNTRKTSYTRQGAEIGVTPNTSGVPQKWMLFNTYSFSNTAVGNSDFAGIEENPVYYTKVIERTYADNGPVSKTEYTFDLGNDPLNSSTQQYTSTRNKNPNIINRGITSRAFLPMHYANVILGNKPELLSKSMYTYVQNSWKKVAKEDYVYDLNPPTPGSASQFRNISISNYARRNTDLSTGLSTANIYTDTNIDSFFDFFVYDIYFAKRRLIEKSVTTYDE